MNRNSGNRRPSSSPAKQEARKPHRRRLSILPVALLPLGLVSPSTLFRLYATAGGTLGLLVPPEEPNRGQGGKIDQSRVSPANRVAAHLGSSWALQRAPRGIGGVPATGNTAATGQLAGMPLQSGTSSCSDDSDDSNAIDPTGIYTMEEYIAEQSVLHNLLERIGVKIQAKIEAQQAGTSRRRSGNRKFIERDHGEGHQRLVADFFSEDAVYDEKLFRTRYRMRRPLFLRIVRALGDWSPYFTKRTDICYRQGLSPLQKCTAAIRMLSRGCPSDAVDEYVQIGQSTAMECLERFAEGVIDKFGGEYLRGPTSVDIQRLLQIGEGCGFPGMLGSIGCMHWEWENCPPKWMRRLNHSDHGFATFVLEAVASQDLWIWCASFNVVGSISDIGVLDQSPLCNEILKGQAPLMQFSVNKSQYNMGYYLANEIYPECNVFVKTIPFPRTEKERLFAQHQEEARKDVQRAFGVFQSRFPIVRGPIRYFPRATLAKIFQACVILHNMAVEDEKDMASACFDSGEAMGTSAVLPSNIKIGPGNCLANIEQRNATLCHLPTHGQLRRDLMEHIWQQFGPFGDK